MSYTQKNAHTWYQDQLLTQPAPALATDGIPVTGIDAFYIVLDAGAGHTVVFDSSLLLCYVYDEQLGFWFRYSDNDVIMSSADTPDRYWMSFKLQQPMRSGMRVTWVANGISLSAGTTVRVYICGATTKGL